MGLSKFQNEAPTAKENSVWGVLEEQFSGQLGNQMGQKTSEKIWGSDKIGNLEIRGSDYFRAEIKGTIEKGKKTPEFQEALLKVQNSDLFNVIEETQDTHSQTVPNPKDPDAWLDSTNGKGTRTVIQINPNDANRGPVDDWGCKKSSPEVILGHELGHVVDMNEGKNNYHPEGKIPPGEKRAMQIENGVRRDQILAARSTYNIPPETPEAPGCRPQTRLNDSVAPSPYPRMGL